MAELLARHFGSIDSLMQAGEEELTSIPSIGPKIAATVVAYFGNESNRRVVEKLRAAGVRLEDALRPEQAKQVFAELRFVVTGRLDRFSRSEIEDRIKGAGWGR